MSEEHDKGVVFLMNLSNKVSHYFATSQSSWQTIFTLQVLSRHGLNVHSRLVVTRY